MMNLARNAEPHDYGQPPEMSSETTSQRAYRYMNKLSRAVSER
jgi:hypothetical protein